MPCYSCSSGTPPLVSCAESFEYEGGIHRCPGYRLPTEAEWELAYRAASVTPYYNDGGPASCDCVTEDQLADDIAWYCFNSGDRPHPVALKHPNGWGLYDMAGNVSEWCNDWYMEDLGVGAVADPVGPSSGEHRIVRGGSYASNARRLRAASRDRLSPQVRYNSVGFRCVRTL